MKRMISPEAWLSLFVLIMLASYLTAQEQELKRPSLLTAKLLKEDPQDDELRNLLKARYNEVVSEMKGLYDLHMHGKGESTIDIFVDPGQRLLQAGLELYDKPAEKVVLLTQYVELTKEIEHVCQLRFDVGAVTSMELHRARYRRLDAEIQLLRAKREADREKGNDPKR